MARGPRISYPGAIFHIINRFVDKHPFFKDDEDYNYFLKIYFEEAKNNSILTFAYCLMPNHFHIVLQTQTGEISKFLHRFLTRVAQQLNKKYNRVGHLFQGRSKTLLIQTELYFKTAIGYVLLNSVRAGISDNIYSYKWNSVDRTMNIKENSIDKEKLFYNLFNENDTILEGIMKFSEWLQQIDIKKNEEHFKNNHRGSFLSSEIFRKQLLNILERRKEKLVCEQFRRKSDKIIINIDWNHLLEKSKEIIKKIKWKDFWTNEIKAQKHICWYIAFTKLGWSLNKIKLEDKKHGGAISTYSSAINKIRKKEEIRDIIDYEICNIFTKS